MTMSESTSAKEQYIDLPSLDQATRRAISTLRVPKSVSLRHPRRSVDSAHRLDVDPSISAIASHFPSWDRTGWKLGAPVGILDPATRPSSVDGPFSGLATRISKSHPPPESVRTLG